MPGQFRENWKRLTGQLTPKGPSAMEDGDIVRVEDLSALMITSTGIPLFNVTNVETASPYYAQETDDLVVILTSGSFDVVLPFEPSVGNLFEIKDGAGDGCSAGVVKQIIPSGSDSIEGIFTSFPLSNCYQSWSLIYAGSGLWRLV